MKTKIVICRKSDRGIRTVHVHEPVDTVREKYIKAALGNRQFKAGKWLIDLDENLVLSIEPSIVKCTGCTGCPVRNPFGPSKVVRRGGRKHPSSAGH